MDTYVVGDVIFRASWARTGLRIEQGKVLLANDERAIVQCGDHSTEGIAQHAPGGWRRTKEEALKHLLSCLSVSKHRVEADALRLQAKIVSIKTMLTQVAELEEGGAA